MSSNPDAEANAAKAADAAANPGPNPKPDAKAGPKAGAKAEAKAGAEQEPEAADQAAGPPPQGAWEAAQELFDHLPPSFNGTLFAGGAPGFGGHLIGGDQHTVSGGRVHGDVFTGNKTEVHHHNAPGGSGPRYAGEVTAAEIDRLMEVFQQGDAFEAALACLRDSRVLVLTGKQSSGRSAASKALLRALEVRTVRVLDTSVGPDDMLNQAEPAPGYVLWDLPVSRNRRLSEDRLRTLRTKLAKDGGYLVITTEDSPLLADLRRNRWTAAWTPPTGTSMLTAHVRLELSWLPGEPDDQALPALRPEPLGVDELLALPATLSFLSSTRTPQEIKEYAQVLARYSFGEATEEELSELDQGAVDDQVAQWFADTDTTLRERAFLVSLAVFDGSAYALAAERGDELHTRLQQIEKPDQPAETPVFGLTARQRLESARATLTERNEPTVWGPLPQQIATFDDQRIRAALLREVWLGHPSARPALIDWISDLAGSADPLVRTRAASATAVLAAVDLPSVMPRLLQPWASSPLFTLRLQAANTLTLLAWSTGAAAVPQILRGWCLSKDERVRWTGIRGHGLIGSVAPEEALRDLGDLVTQPDSDPGAEEVDALESATSLLLVTTSRSLVLARLVSWLEPRGPRRSLALIAFLRAGWYSEDAVSTPLSWPSLLRWYSLGAATAGGPPSVTTLAEAEEPQDRQHLVCLWWAALAEPQHTDQARELLRHWIRTAERDPEAEQGIASLLRALAVSEDDRLRLSHLVRTLAEANKDTPLARISRRLLLAADLPDPDPNQQF
ncbi:hypothetical protein ACEZDB_20510 [Streptacidiphilus sp. N1-3]|uniref:Uncharacterized protein n=1 Tax=Streptacidiphilus alkalitolerans TaxID=3342712 RepID=A0ABV6X403_9ACTN